MKKTSVRKVKSADRTLDLLELLAHAPAAMSAAALSDALGIPKSSLFHLVGTLTERRYLTLVDGKAYRLGPMIAELARGVEPDRHLARLVEPVLEELCAAINESCAFNVQRGDDVEVVATRAGRQALTYTMQVGDLAPLYAVSGGKIMLAYKDQAWLDGYLKRVRFEKFTPNTIQSHERLLREIERARVEGFGFVEEEFTHGIVGIAAAVRQGDSVVGALNVAVPSPRFDSQKASQIRQQLRGAVSRAEALIARLR
ncbi:IclR family transcriptional regulator [Polymorphum gilvum]|uniref:Transcriptional regulator, IclR family n=1 Tax=Polymorphum gilvum (strain LMG 25793 / CGMCC 1.9160 / SL003B-26A1) TaxID=991905 RepID=F2J2J0_POLGS|nr:IclR family transcriptional regulator [Polymorphum gilvum]ADZ70904.1 Transcriptional regulator, IclR family [Polymorphum gilvum SL003B-26A1]